MVAKNAEDHCWFSVVTVVVIIRSTEQSRKQNTHTAYASVAYNLVKTRLSEAIAMLNSKPCHLLLLCFSPNFNNVVFTIP